MKIKLLIPLPSIAFPTNTKVVMKNNTTIKRWRGLLEAAKNDDDEAVKYWVEQRNASVAKIDARNQTAAHYAIENSNLGMLKYLILHEKTQKNFQKTLIKMKDVDGHTIFHLAVKKGSNSIIRYLLDELETDIDPFEPLEYHPVNNAIHTAAEYGYLDMLKYFIAEKHGDPNVRNKFQETPIFIAVEEEHFHIVKYLVEEGNADVFLTNWNRDNILHYASYKGDLNVIKYLLDERQLAFEINARNDLGETYLYRAACFNRLPFIEYLVEKKNADVNISDFTYKTALFRAAFFGYFDIVKYLVEHGADPEMKDERDKRPIDVAVKGDIRQYLRKKSEKRNRRAIDTVSIFPRPSVRAPSPSIDPHISRYMLTRANCSESSMITPVNSTNIDNILILANIYSHYFYRPKRKQVK